MTNYNGTDVFRLIGINHPDEIESDNQFEAGRLGIKVGKKVRVQWDRDDSVEYINSDKLHKLDKNTFWLSPDNSDKDAEADIAHTADVLVKAAEEYANQGETDKDVQTELKREQSEPADLNDNSGNPDNFDEPVKPVRKARTSRTTAKSAE